MNKLVKTDINPNVRNFAAVGSEKNKITINQIGGFYSLPFYGLICRFPGKLGIIVFPENALCKGTAIQTAGML